MTTRLSKGQLELLFVEAELTSRGCSFQGCPRPHYAHGHCQGHYRQQRSGRPMTPLAPLTRACSVPDCDDPHVALGYCKRHYMTGEVQKALGRVCFYPGCGRGVRAKGLCYQHYEQQRSGKPLTPIGKRRDPAAVCVVVEDGELCGERQKGQGYCNLHYQRFRKHGDPLGGGRRMAPPSDGMCTDAGCHEPARYKGLCGSHYYLQVHIRDKHRQANIARLFHLDSDTFLALLAFQGGCCGVCGTTDPPDNGTVWSWNVDHDHNHCETRGRSCGKCVRGLLCRFCNMLVVPAAEKLGEGGVRVMEYLTSPPFQRMKQLVGVR